MNARVTASLLMAGLIAQSASANERLPLVERATKETTVDLGPKGDSPGDLLVFENQVYDADNRTQAGSDQGFCVRIAVSASWECTWTLKLAKGQLTVHGPVSDNTDTVLSITGGTGRYAGAKGTLKVHRRDATGSSYDFLIDLL